MCLFPNSAYIQKYNGRIKFHHEGDLKLPCGKCTECISKRSIEWATRAKHEIATHEENSFITLTYDETNLPSIMIVKDEFQKFIKRLRKHIKKPIRYMVSHEYGSNNFRPHHHVIIFGYNPSQQQLLKTTKTGEKIFTSKEIKQIWNQGFHSIGTANEKTAYYIASYSLKGKKHIFPDPNTGELINVADSMDCSKRPAIGLKYFEKNYQQLIDTKQILPRYYIKKLEKINPEMFEIHENERLLNLKNRNSHEIYAKYNIDQQKKNIKTEFREIEPNTKIESCFYKTELQTNRDEYHRQTKG